MDILQLIDRLEELVDRGWRVPLGGKVAIEEESFLNIIDQMRITVPQEIKQAREVQQDRDKYIAQANEEARRILAQAREDAAKQLDEHELRKAARVHAEQVLEQANQDALRIRVGADDYAEGKLRDLGHQVILLQKIIQNGLTELQSRRSEPTIAPKEIETAEDQTATTVPEEAIEAAEAE